MTPGIFATRSLSTRDQFEAWRAWYGSVFEVVPKAAAAAGFPGETQLWQLGGLVISRTSAPPAQVVRNKSHLRRDPADHWVVSFCVRGAHLAKTRDSELEVPAGVPFLWSLGQELVYERTHVDRVQLFLARDSFRNIAPLLDAACGSMLDTALGRLLGDYMIALEQRLPDIPEADFPSITTAFSAVAAAAVAPTAERVAVARRQIDLGRRERVRQVVRRHLRTPTLSPKTLSRLVGMSRSNLYRLFSDNCGVAQYIQSQRLLEAHSMLADPGNRQSITTLAEDLCFADLSSFSRAFKREFGCRPSDARAAALSGAPLLPRAASKETDFSDFLRG
jgi:AraC-like DNA-binding protein